MTLLESLLSRLAGTTTRQRMLDAGRETFKNYINEKPMYDETGKWNDDFFRRLLGDELSDKMADKNAVGPTLWMHNSYLAVAMEQGWWVRLPNGDWGVSA